MREVRRSIVGSVHHVKLPSSPSLPITRDLACVARPRKTRHLLHDLDCPTCQTATYRDHIATLALSDLQCHKLNKFHLYSTFHRGLLWRKHAQRAQLGTWGLTWHKPVRRYRAQLGSTHAAGPHMGPHVSITSLQLPLSAFMHESS